MSLGAAAAERPGAVAGQARTGSPAILRCLGLVAGYGDLEVLHGVSLEVRRGEVVALIGANGSGKSTTLRAVSGLVKPWSGRVEFLGRRTDGAAPGTVVALGLAHVPEGRGLFPEMSVWDNLILGAQTSRDKSAGARRRRLTEVCSLFPVLQARRRQPAGTLSGGEQQMLAIARGLMADPELLVLDEPSLGLAPRLVKQLFTDMSALRREGKTILLVEQNVRHALELADWAYVLDGGRVRIDGPGAELARSDEVRRAYLGV